VSDEGPGAATEEAPQAEAVQPLRRRGQRRVFAAFAGGGAKGLVHVGALAALKERKVRIVGFSGTSAGAIVAALAAVGFEPDEIINPSDSTSILSLLEKHDGSLKRPTDLFGPGAWRAISRYRVLHNRLTKRILIIALVVAVALVLASTVIVSIWGPWAAAFAIIIWGTVVTLVICEIARALGGLARLETLRDALDKLMSEKAGFGRQVLMEDFDGKLLPRLKIVAANLTGRRLELFSCESQEKTPVADAVAASICLPIIFGMWRIGSGRYVDGGIVSNLPAWPFDEERQLDPEAITIAFDIGKPHDAEPKTPTSLTWPVAIMDTAMFGSRMLSRRAVGLSELITFRPTIEMMAFDLSAEKTREELDNATKFALAEIDRRLFTYPETYESACDSVMRPTERFLDGSGVLVARRTGRVRVGVALPPEGFRNSLRIRFVANFEDDPDQQVLVPLEGSFVGAVWASGKPRLFMKPFPATYDMQTPNRRALRRFFWRDLAWSLCVPIFGADGKPRCVVTVDGSDRLVDSRKTRSAFNDLAVEVRKVFEPIVLELQE
jgi:NTE family protein